jgi:protoheme IX farnesyltransferase
MSINETIEFAADAPASFARTTEKESLWHAYLVLFKVKVAASVTGTTAAGFLLAGEGSSDLPRLWATLAGTLLCASGAGALNQWQERRLDALMERTRRRPLPAGMLTPTSAFWAGGGALAVGLAILACVHWLPVCLAALAALFYLAIYAPLKTRSPFCTLFGAVVGAIPPAIGWTAATGRLDAGAWLFAAILFVWQIPHFLALAWRWRQDYARAGFRMLPNVDPSGRSTGNMIVVGCVALLLLGPTVSLAGLAGPACAAGSALLGLFLLALGAFFRRRRSHENARSLFQATMVYLFLLFSLMLADRGNALAEREPHRSTNRAAPRLTTVQDPVKASR